MADSRAPRAVAPPTDPAHAPARADPGGRSPSLPFRRDIQGLRGLAVLLVVAYHASVPGLGGGFVGVDVFFVLSGYLITSLLVREVATTGRVRLPAFYARRIRRLLPAAAAVILATLLAGALLHPPHVHRDLARTAVAAGAYVSNLWLGWKVGDYFGGEADDDPLLHMWSLSVEEQFYLLWPIVVIAGLRGTASRQRLGLIMAGLILFSLAGSWWYSIVSRPIAFYASPLRAWEFAAGGLLTLAPARTRLPRAPVALLGAVGLAAILGSALVLSAGHPFPGLNAVPVVAGTLLVLWPGHVQGPGSRVLDHPAMQRLGDLSYSWYLWHWPVLVFLTLLAPAAGWPWRVLAAFGALLPAALAYRYLETPLRHHRWLAGAPGRTLAFGVALTAIVVVVSLAGVSLSGRIAASPEYRAITEAADLGVLERARCVARVTEDTPRECTYGTGAAGLIVLIGDSHASQWGPALIPAVEALDARLVVLIKSSCPAADYLVTERRLGRRFHECERWRAAALARIEALRPDVVVVANARSYLRAGRYLGDGDAYAAWGAALRRALERLSRSAGSVIVLQDTPWIGRDVPDCLAAAMRLFGDSGDCSRSRGAALDDRLARVQRAVASGLPDVTVADLTDRFCSRSRCPGVIRGTIGYRDGHHISSAMAASLEPEIRALLGAALQGGRPSR